MFSPCSRSLFSVSPVPRSLTLATRAFSTLVSPNSLRKEQRENITANNNKGGKTADSRKSSFYGCPTIAAFTQTRRIVEPTRKQRIQQPDKIDVKVGDFVRYKRGDSTTEGMVVSLFAQPFVDEIGRTHDANADRPIVQIQNQYTQNLVYQHLPAVHWLARKEEAPSGYQTASNTTPPPKNTISPNAEEKGTVDSNTTNAPPKVSSTPPKKEKEQTGSTIREMSESDLVEKKKADCSLLIDIPFLQRVEFAPGDIVRYRIGRGITAGLVQGVYFSPHYQGATKKSPVARVANLWSQKTAYHNLNALELVKKADEVAQSQKMDFASTIQSRMESARAQRLHA